jgi:hypothetical protein
MSLSALVPHPSRCSYVLKLHRDATPASGQLFGRLENIATGHCFVFGSVAELLRCLAADATGPDPFAVQTDQDPTVS